MITTTHPQPRRAVRRSLPVLLAASLAFTASLRSEEWYLGGNQPAGDDWSTLTLWKSNADGTGNSPAALSSADTYRTNNYTVRTPETKTSATFPGGLLFLEGGGGCIAIKTSSADGLAIIPNLVSTGGKIQNSSGGTQYVQIGHHEVRSGTTSWFAQAGRSLKVTVGTMAGGGRVRLAGGGKLLVDIADAGSYIGDLWLKSGTLDFEGEVNSGGHLVIEIGTRVSLDQRVSFAGLTIAGVTYGIGTYNHATLQAAHPAIFTEGTSKGAITVRPPRNWYLSRHSGRYAPSPSSRSGPHRSSAFLLTSDS